MLNFSHFGVATMYHVLPMHQGTQFHPTLTIIKKLCEDLSPTFRELLYDWRFTANQFVLATNPLRLTTNNFILRLNTWGYSPYVTSSLTIGWVCRLQLLLVLASAVILRSESRETHDILLSQTTDSPNLDGQVPVFISPRNHHLLFFHYILSI
jgi:hypothetical protein